MPRSIGVLPEGIERVKSAIRQSGFPSQRALARDLGRSHSTIARFVKGKPVDYQTFLAICERLGLDWLEMADLDHKGSSSFWSNTQAEEEIATQRQDWGQSPDVSIGFYGRTEELAKLEQWIVRDRCRLVALLGMGGIGKTSLSAKLAREIQDEFECCIWRSLRNAPTLTELLADVMQFLVPDRYLPDIDQSTSRLIEYLQAHRCLLVLDDWDTILESGSFAGRYRCDREGYGELLKQVGEVNHQSCLVLNSRDKPKEIAVLEGDHLPVRVLRIMGLDEQAARQILRDKGLFNQNKWQILINLYRGNPLALKIVSNTIKDLFLGRVSQFLELDTIIYTSLEAFLLEVFGRLSSSELDILNYLANNEQPVSVQELQSEINLKYRSDLMASLISLSDRSLLETFSKEDKAVFTLHPLVKEYVLMKSPHA
ncbi:MAG: NACHT domain-containing protein [Oscillatoria sp. SIO1A7]|nr:NACHT domain-containing protein [Oscillatoria sp. SIO1A7]